MDELGAKDDQLAEFVENSNAVFATLASQDANLRATLQRAAADARRDPARARQGQAARRRARARRCRRCGRAPARSARRCAACARSCTKTTPMIRDEIRPFVRASRPTVDRAAADAQATSRPPRPTSRARSRSSTTCSTSSPTTRRAQEEGYLFWVAWANHLGEPALQRRRTRTARSAAASSSRAARTSPVLEQVVAGQPAARRADRRCSTCPKQNCPTTTQDPLRRRLVAH